MGSVVHHSNLPTSSSEQPLGQVLSSAPVCQVAAHSTQQPGAGPGPHSLAPELFPWPPHSARLLADGCPHPMVLCEGRPIEKGHPSFIQVQG